MNELEEVEGINKKTNKQQGLKSSKTQQAAEQTWQHATGKGSSIEIPNGCPKGAYLSFLCNQGVRRKKKANHSSS